VTDPRESAPPRTPAESTPRWASASSTLDDPRAAEAVVEIVFEPPWNPGMMSEAARLELGMM
jgi:metal-sulfur cluster biosynthetic enzyme